MALHTASKSTAQTHLPVRAISDRIGIAPPDSAQQTTPEAAFEFDLLNRWQRDMPLTPEPFRKMGEAHGRSTHDVLAVLAQLKNAGAISRVGAVLAPAAFGASTLAAVSVPAGQLEAVAEYVSSMPEVNHNYARDHRYNLWFVLTAVERERIDAALSRIGEVSACVPLDLPILEGYHIDLGFDLTGKTQQSPRSLDAGRARVVLDQRQRRMLAALECGLPLVARPYAQLGVQAQMHEHEVIEQLRQWLATGAIRRLGVVVRHHELGIRANAMCVWDVPDADAAALGRRMAEIAGVNLCYRRARVSGRWPYNMYCMIHGRERESVLAIREKLVAQLGIEHLASATLFSRQRFKQCGARYAES